MPNKICLVVTTVSDGSFLDVYVTYSHMDSYMCFMAASYVLSQIILSGDKRIYHQEHTRPSRATQPTTDFKLCL